MATLRKSQRNVIRSKYKNKHVSDVFRNMRAKQGMEAEHSRKNPTKKKKKKSLFKRLFGFRK